MNPPQIMAGFSGRFAKASGVTSQASAMAEPMSYACPRLRIHEKEGDAKLHLGQYFASRDPIFGSIDPRVLGLCVCRAATQAALTGWKLFNVEQ